VIVKRGTLKVDDIFVSGIHEGKVKFMMNDRGQTIKEAFPGEAVYIGGFKHFPDVGNPLYVVKDHSEAAFIVQQVNKRAEQEEILKLA
jgi:translation initiation factor IF-2